MQKELSHGLLRSRRSHQNPQTRHHRSCSCSGGGGGGSGTEKEQNKPMHGKWCNSIHLQVNPSGEPSRVPSTHSAAPGAGPTPGSRRQEARAARRARPRPCTEASAAWRPPPWRRGPADPSVASASLLSVAPLCALPPHLGGAAASSHSAPQSSSAPWRLQPTKQPFRFSP